jgi:hypothetical protein
MIPCQSTEVTAQHLEIKFDIIHSPCSGVDENIHVPITAPFAGESSHY